MLGIAMFVASAVLTSTFRIPKGERPRYKTYASVLGQLFKPVKKPNRHSDKALTTQEIFNIRKNIFREIYAKQQLLDANVIHVAGTKGKGSTVEYIASGLISQKLNVGVFTSPHLHTARERIKIGRELISREKIIEYGNSALEYLTNFDFTVFFDLLLAVGLMHFGEQKARYIIMESGIGGRYDSTNFVERPKACVITSISLDHQALLGNTIEEIAWQKAGIIKQNSHVFTPKTQLPSVLDVFRKQCESRNAILHEVDINEDHIKHLQLNIQYDVQIENACLALSVLKHLNVNPEGMKDFYWPCRMETFQLRLPLITSTNSNNNHYNNNDLVSIDNHEIESKTSNTKQYDIVLDGCHNGDSVEHFLASLYTKYHHTHEIIIVFGAGHEKCIDDMLLQLWKYSDKILMIQSKHFKSMSEYELISKTPVDQRYKLLRYDDVGYNIEQLVRKQDGTVHERLQSLIDQYRNSNKKPLVAVCGSLFVAAEAREFLYKIDPTLFKENDWVTQVDPIV